MGDLCVTLIRRTACIAHQLVERTRRLEHAAGHIDVRHKITPARTVTVLVVVKPHDLTLQQLSLAIGKNRTYLGAYFTQQGITYNAYINRLRIEHFIRLYKEAKDSTQPITAKKLAEQSGFRSYITFSSAFKNFIGMTVTEWMKNV